MKNQNLFTVQGISGGLRCNDLIKSSLKELPLVTIITVTYNSDLFLEDTIKSVLGQTYNNIEYIIIDGGSTDGTLEIIERYSDAIDLWISEPDRGIYDAMNKGLKFATGEIIGIINSDDWYLKNAIEEVVQSYKEDKTFNQIVVGNINRCSENGDILRPVRNNSDLIKGKYNRKMPLTHPSTFVSSLIYKKIGNFNTDYKICADYDFIYSCIENKIKIVFIDSILVNMRIGGISDRLSEIITILSEMYIIRRKRLNQLMNSYIFLTELIRIYLVYTVKFLLKIFHLKGLLLKHS